MIEYYKRQTLKSLFYVNDKGLVCYEEWFDIPFYENLYKISTIGRVKSLEKFQVKYPKETFELSPSGRNSDRQHGFHSGILAGCRLYSSVIDEGLEQALEEFPFLDS